VRPLCNSRATCDCTNVDLMSYCSSRLHYSYECMDFAGFSFVHDLTYPFTTQCVVTDGQMFRFFCYQLNTLRLWVDDGVEPSCNPLRNIVWASDPMPLYNPDTQSLNEDVFKVLLRCILLQPAVRHGVEMRPYLPDEEAPVQNTVFLNNKGEELLPYVKIGQFQYPRNAVYF